MRSAKESKDIKNPSVNNMLADRSLKRSSALRKNIVKFLNIAFPIIILIIGLIVDLVIVPNLYGETCSCIYWLLIDPQNIMAIICRPNVALPVKVFWFIWLISFVVSLICLCRRLHVKKQPNAVDAIFINREPYLMIQNVRSDLMQIKHQQDSKELNALIYAVKCLEEKLAIESDFGYGDDRVIDCENDIARQIHILVNATSNMKDYNFQDIDTLKSIVLKINFLLRRRRTLKRR